MIRGEYVAFLDPDNATKPTPRAPAGRSDRAIRRRRRHWRVRAWRVERTDGTAGQRGKQVGEYRGVRRRNAISRLLEIAHRGSTRRAGALSRSVRPDRDVQRRGAVARRLGLTYAGRARGALCAGRLDLGHRRCPAGAVRNNGWAPRFPHYAAVLDALYCGRIRSRGTRRQRVRHRDRRSRRPLARGARLAAPSRTGRRGVHVGAYGAGSPESDVIRSRPERGGRIDGRHPDLGSTASTASSYHASRDQPRFVRGERSNPRRSPRTVLIATWAEHGQAPQRARRNAARLALPASAAWRGQVDSLYARRVLTTCWRRAR